MSDLQLTKILQEIDGEQFEWWLHPLADGRTQAMWRESITGGLSCTMPMQAHEFRGDARVLGEHAYRLQRERIMTIDGTEYHLEGYGGRTFVRWLDHETGEELRAAVVTSELSVVGIPAADVLASILNPMLRTEQNGL